MKILVLTCSIFLLTACGFADDTNGVMAIRLCIGETSLERYTEYGYTAAALGDLTRLASYDSLAPGAIAENSELRGNIERYRQDFLKKAAQAKDLGQDVCLVTD